MTDENKSTAQADGDGGSADIDAAEITKLLKELESIRDKAGSTITRKRDLNQKIRYCKWDGQSTDGLKHEEDLGEKPFPFEGCTDGRIRLADMIINENVLVMVAAASRMTVRVKGGDFTDEDKARKIQTLIRWQIKNNIGWSNFLREITLLANYQEGDHPAAACLGVYWEREKALTMETLTFDNFLQATAELIGANDQAMIQDLADMIMNPERAKEAEISLRAMIPYISAKRARKMVKELRETQQCQFPRPYYRVNRPRIKAERIFDTIYFPTNTGENIQRARIVFMPELYSEAETRAMAAEEQWNESFLNKVLEQPEWSMFSDNDGDQAADEDIDSGEPRTGMYEIITAFFKAVNDDGIMGIYMVRLHGNVKEAAREKQLFDYKHGKYPWVFFSREILSNRLLDTRSISEVTQTAQETLKLHHDSFNDHVSISTIPPVFVPYGQGDIELMIQPLGRIPRRKAGDYDFMTPPSYPQANDQARKHVQKMVDEYHGRMNADVAPELWTLHKQGMADRFLAGLQDAMMMVVQLCQQYMTDAEISRVTGGNGMPLIRSVEEIQGQFDLELSFDVKDMNPDYVIKLAEALSQWVLPMDTTQTIMRDRLVQRVFMAIDPVLAEDTLRPVEQASAAEASDEENNFAKINAGVEPPMMEDGQNYALRLQVLMGVGEKNPEAFAKLSPQSRAILEKRIDHLKFMVSQEENKMIGRVGAAPALGEGT